MNLTNGLYNFYYHDVSDCEVVPAGFRTRPSRFREEIRFIADNFAVLPFNQAIAEQRRHLQTGTHWQCPTATVTFDDGYRGVLNAAAPVLQEFRVPATVFLNSAYLSGGYVCPVVLASYADRHWARAQIEEAFEEIAPGQSLRNFVRNRLDRTVFEKMNALLGASLHGSELYLTTADLHRLPTDLIQFGNHTYHHLRLSLLARAEQREEIVSNDAALRGTPGYQPLISIPFGGADSFDEDTRALVRELGDGYLILATGSIRHRDQDGLLTVERMGMSDNKPPIRRLIERRLRGLPDRSAVASRFRSLGAGLRWGRLRQPIR